MLRIYHTAVAGGNVLSVEGVFSAPDESNYEGRSGETVAKKLFIAPAQTTLVTGINSSAVDLVIAHPIFFNTKYRKIIIDSEVMTIIAGFGTTLLTVTRGDSPASHAADAAIYAAYTYDSITLAASDESGDDESGWLTYAPDSGGSPGSYVSSLSPTSMTDPTSDSYTFWRKIIVPASTAATRNATLRHKLTYNATEYAA